MTKTRMKWIHCDVGCEKAVALGNGIIAGETLRASVSTIVRSEPVVSLSVWYAGKCVSVPVYKRMSDASIVTCKRIATKALNDELRRRGYPKSN